MKTRRNFLACLSVFIPTALFAKVDEQNSWDQVKPKKHKPAPVILTDEKGQEWVLGITSNGALTTMFIKDYIKKHKINK